MPSPSNYTELVTQVTALAEDDSAEFLAYLPTAIGLAEDRLFREIDIDLTTTSTLSLTPNVQTLAKPVDYRLGHNFYIVVNNEKTRLIKKTEDFLNDYWPNATLTAIPKYYAERDQDNFLFVPTPSAAYQVVVEYTAKPVALSSANATNVLITKYPDLLFYATLSNVCEWQKDPERKQEWEGKLQGALLSTNNEGRRFRQDDDAKASRNTLQG